MIPVQEQVQSLESQLKNTRNTAKQRVASFQEEIEVTARNALAVGNDLERQLARLDPTSARAVEIEKDKIVGVLQTLDFRTVNGVPAGEFAEKMARGLTSL